MPSTTAESLAPSRRVHQKTGVLLMNVGTPDNTSTGAVRRYLREFLSDPRVIDINAVGRFLLLEGIILPFRPAKSAEAYRKVWTTEGAPLLVHGRALEKAVGEALGDDFAVKLGMRYGNPSLKSVLATFRKEGIDRIVLFPLYPQYAASSTGTSLERVYELVAGEWNVPTLSSVPPFYDHPGLIEAFAVQGRPVLDRVRPDHVIFSFHGLPERQIRKSDETGSHCLTKPDCCAAMCPENRWCYRAQCFETARLLAKSLGLADGTHDVTFQSRLGRTPWIRPYTDVVIEELAAKGSKRIVVFCPAFVADCLETLEEVGMRLQEDYGAGGGEVLELVPSLNATPAWVSTAAELVRAASARAA